jgi:hypothetical protein
MAAVIAEIGLTSPTDFDVLFFLALLPMAGYCFIRPFFGGSVILLINSAEWLPWCKSPALPIFASRSDRHLDTSWRIDQWLKCNSSPQVKMILPMSLGGCPAFLRLIA